MPQIAANNMDHRRAAVRRTAWSLALVAAAIFVAFVAYGIKA